MPSGGARVRSGGPPNFHALKRERDKTFTRLPRECSLPIPDWPVEIPPPTLAELAMWQRLWQTPQAHVWHADGAADSVAIYVRSFIEAAKPGASAIARTGARQQANELLLGIAALHAARYVITGSPEDQILQSQATGTDGPAAPARPGQRRTSSARSRMTVVSNSGPVEPSDDEEVEDDADA